MEIFLKNIFVLCIILLLYPPHLCFHTVHTETQFTQIAVYVIRWKRGGNYKSFVKKNHQCQCILDKTLKNNLLSFAIPPITTLSLLSTASYLHTNWSTSVVQRLHLT